MSAALILILPFASQHLVNQETRAALETTTALAAAIAGGVSAMFIGGRRRLRDQLLAAGLVTAACGLVASSFGIFPTFASGGSQPAADVLLATNLALGVGFLLASVFGDRPAHPGRRGALVIAVGFALGVLLIGELLSALMPAGPGNGTVLHTPVLMLRLLTAAAFGLAGVRFVGGGRTAVNELLAGASILFAIEQLAALAIPSFRDWVTIRDPLRVIAWMLVLVAAGVEVRARQQELNRAALQSERERIARDIHDGIVQDLAAIAIHGASLGERLGEQHPMIVAARSAIAASRQTINDLSASSARSTADALRTVGEELGAKLDLDVRVCASAGGRELAGAHREHAVRIAREAIVNAARHGGARNVDVNIASVGDEWLLTVADDGSGIGPWQADDAPGFGIRAMRARAAELGGLLSIRRRPSGGTVVELRIGGRPAGASHPRLPGSSWNFGGDPHGLMVRR